MASDLLAIAASGARAARGALDVTAQNIANAASDGYVRRTARMEEVSAAGGQMRMGDLSLSGVRISGIQRNADMFRQSEVRRTTADSSRGAAELAGLQNVQAAVEQSGVYSAVVGFEASLQALTADPVDPAMRAEVIASAQAMTNKFNIAAGSLDSAGEGLRFNAQAGVDQANVYGGELARLNLRIGRAGADSSDRATLLDQRDLLLGKLSDIADISTSFGPDGSVRVGLGAGGATDFVTGGTAATLTMATATDGTVSFQAGGNAFTPSGGLLAGSANALVEVAGTLGQLDTLADSMAAAFNTVQTGGITPAGSPGQPLFSGSGAGGITTALTDGAMLATAPAGAAIGSRDASNLAAMRQALESGGTASGVNRLLFDVSSKVAGREVTQGALDAIASSASVALEEQAGVDLDTEAANLIRFQQAFQASGRAMQVASTIFDTLLGIK
ncbi:MAG: hypothetical protein RLZZ08_209 [Pseudomonadota bacterium]|jgi:flagellar hook-associated protein 1 FlgK